MPRLLGVDIPNDHPTIISLTYLYGVGPKIARELCHKAGVNPHGRARDLREDELAASWTSAAIAASGIAAVCRYAASGPAPTPARGRAPRRPWRARRA